MAEDRAFCPHCYAPVIAGRKTCPKCGRNVSDAPPASKKAKQGASGSATFAVLGALVVVLAIASWVLLR
jgi:hypothetical protein